MKPQSAKAKGRSGAKEVKQLLVEHLGCAEEDIAVRSSGANGEDLILAAAARALFPFSPEIKRVEKLNIWEALAQAKANAGQHTPILLFRRNRSQWFVALETEAFLDIVREARGTKNPNS